MKLLNELRYGFADAENYKRRENRDVFNQGFLRTQELDAIDSPNTFFVVGEKGTGKTAYAVYLSNANNPTHSHLHRFIRETDYLKFISLKSANALNLSNYVDVWKVILLSLTASSILEHEPKPFVSKNDKFTALVAALENYNENALNPEVISGLRIAESASDIAKLMIGIPLLRASGSEQMSTEMVADKKTYQSDLLKIERMFEDAIGSLKLQKSHTIFIDGIDLRPDSVPYSEYQSCIKGLANALWSLNNDFLPSIKDSKGRCKVVALLRPDIFNSMGLQNRNTKLKDNSVVLDWRTRYTDYRESKPFKVADKFFSVQQSAPTPPGQAWDHYFPFDATEVSDSYQSPSSFISILRFTFHRPRDIFAIIDTLNKVFVNEKPRLVNFTEEHIRSREFKRAYGVYMLGEVQDSLSFYYDEKEYELFLKFFEFLDGNFRFDYSKFLSAYADFRKHVDKVVDDVPDFMENAEDFLQFLYDQNIICFIEDAGNERFIRWCFIERTPSNISPKIKTDVQYEIHYSLTQALNTGKKIRSQRGSATSVVKPSKSGFFEGRVKFFDAEKRFGFIIQDGMPVDVFAHEKHIMRGVVLEKGDRVRFRLEKDKQDRLNAVDIMKV